ncbi:MAG: hypothetical protein Q4C91_03965 [Eubacteriales bacterium]|nr:hypothetical protein [Eubacteriales bacterium]
MGYGRMIPNGRMEEIRRYNQRIEETSDELEKEIYRKAKSFRVPYEKLDMISRDSAEKIYILNKKRKKKRFIKIMLGVIPLLSLILFCVLSLKKADSIRSMTKQNQAWTVKNRKK